MILRKEKTKMISFKCSCEMKEHKAPVEKYVIGAGVLSELSDYVKEYKRICAVCDETVYEIMGKRIMDGLKAEEKLFSSCVLPAASLPGYETVGNILVHLSNPKADSDIFEYSPLPDLILAIGSGVVNDSCRLVSYRFGIPYGIVGSAPSMDGYLSAGTPFLFDGTKATIKCTTPRFLIADTDIMKDAPFDMLLAGIGDMFGKYTGILDWELARDYNGDYYCEKIASDVIEATDRCLENGYKLKSRDSECIKNIMEGFTVTGLGMAYTGNSRPASGSEHIIAHTWELSDVKAGRKPNLHGIEVCEGTRVVAEMYRLIYERTEDAHLKELISKYLGYFDEIEKFCKVMEMPTPVTDVEEIVKSVMTALTLRDRYTVLFYLNGRGELESYAREAAERLFG